MEVCRLCGIEKIDDELVMLLMDQCGSITLKDYVEFYCRLALDSDPNLPQNVCKSCKNLISTFGEFCFKIEEVQHKFRRLKTKHETQEENIVSDNNSPEKKTYLEEFDDTGSDSLLVEKTIENIPVEIKAYSIELEDSDSNSLLEETEAECDEEPMELIDSYIEFDPYLFCEPSNTEQTTRTESKLETTTSSNFKISNVGSVMMTKQRRESIFKVQNIKSQRKVRDSLKRVLN